MEFKEYVKANILPSKDWSKEQHEAVAKSTKNILLTHGIEEGLKIIGRTITQDITPLFDRLDIANVVGNVGRVEHGEKVTLKTKKGLVGYVHAKGTYALRTQWSHSISEITTEQLSVNAEAIVQDLLANRVGSLADMQADVLEELVNTSQANIWALVKAAITTNTNSITTANWTAAGSAAKTAINDAIKTVSDYGNVRAILGRLPAVAPLADLGLNESNPTLADLQNTGMVLGSYRNAPVLSIRANLDREGTNRIDDDTVILIADGGVETKYVGDFLSGSAQNVDAWLWNVNVTREYGLAVKDQRLVYKLSLT